MTSNVALRRDNHFVPQHYLKRWATSDKKLWAYRLLVSHENIPNWKHVSPKGVAYQSHLYTQLVGGQETDEFEQWLGREFEAPAEEALEKATTDARLKPTDWEYLVRFLAAQDVRTPARLQETLKHWQKKAPTFLNETLRNSLQKIEEASAALSNPIKPHSSNKEYVPFRVIKEPDPTSDSVRIRLEMTVGRGLWLFNIKHLLTRTINSLLEYRWTILKPPTELNWLTSDDPVVRLNAYEIGRYDFGGSWGSLGTDIFLPLGPKHLLYTQIGHRPPARGEIVSREQARLIRRLTAEHADRMIFSNAPDDDVPHLHPRVVNRDAVEAEREQWRKWHAEQSEAEFRATDASAQEVERVG